LRRDGRRASGRAVRDVRIDHECDRQNDGFGEGPAIGGFRIERAPTGERSVLVAYADVRTPYTAGSLHEALDVHASVLDERISAKARCDAYFYSALIDAVARFVPPHPREVHTRFVAFGRACRREHRHVGNEGESSWRRFDEHASGIMPTAHGKSDARS
jgi:hypothetical protein